MVETALVCDAESCQRGPVEHAVVKKPISVVGEA